MKARWIAGLLVLLGALAATVSLAIRPGDPDGGSFPYPAYDDVTSPSAEAPAEDPASPEEIRVTFGLERDPKTRVRVLRKIPASVTAPEEAEPPDSEGDATEASPPDAPVVVSARLRSDLVSTSEMHEFPADQVTVAAVPEGVSGLRLTVTVDPVEPEAVAEGTYQGDVIVEGGAPEPYVIPIFVTLGSRTGGMFWAALVLIFGAALGLGIKWVTEVAGVLGSLRRKALRLRRYFSGREDALPHAVRDQLADAHSRILTQETEGLLKELDVIDERKTDLAAFAGAVGALESKVKDQIARTPANAPHVMHFAVQKEREFIVSLQATAWPWPESSGVVAQAIEASPHFDALTQLITCYEATPEAERPTLSRILHEYSNGNLKAGYESWLTYVKESQPGAYVTSERRETAAAGAAQKISRALLAAAPDDGRGGLMDRVLQHARKFAAGASVVIVMLTGLQLQYLNNAAFSNTPADWLNLFLWAFAVELSGVSLLELVGRLTPDARAAVPR